MPKNGLHPQKKKKDACWKVEENMNTSFNSQPDWGASGKKDLILTDLKLNSS